MSYLEWIITRSNLPEDVKEVLYELVEGMSDSMEEEMEDFFHNIEIKVGEIEECLLDDEKRDTFIDANDLRRKVNHLEEEVKYLIEETDEPEKVELKDGAILKEIECPHCGGKFDKMIEIE